ncbi:type IV pilus twitching motility protein PilT [Clostridium thermobutyricum]|uniref:type IV pilus twitching motility protein PilT n=1 Tax=Clostridium thermobutyricum TaxID=29372 RepID=UPI0018A94120|nr:type IV pilus twitching motility protein PilT [Clostridium thermobutyricum]
MYSLNELLTDTVLQGGSDLHLTVGVPPMIRISGYLRKLGEEVLNQEDVKKFAKEILKERFEEYDSHGEKDLAYSLSNVGRFRVNIFKQRGSDAIAMRVMNSKTPTLESLNHPPILKELCKKRRGLVLVTGPTGSGKSTTLAAMINEINEKRNEHIITLEDPIEYLHSHKKCIVNQREIGKDSISYSESLKSLLREDPDIILIGEMRDLETISIAITAAETGHLVLSTLHTIGSAKTIDRIIDVFPVHQQQQIKVQLAAVLQGIISQQLIPSLDGKRVAALETMIITPAIQNQIREGKTHQIDSAIQTGSKFGMQTMDMSLTKLVKSGQVDINVAKDYSVDGEMFDRLMMY